MDEGQKKVLVNRFDHLEMAVANLAMMQSLFENLGYTCTQVRESPQLKQRLMVQGQSRILLSEGGPGTFQKSYVEAHGDGVCSIAYHSVNAAETLALAQKRGAQVAQETLVEIDKVSGLTVKTSAIKSFGDVRATFVERSGEPFNVDQVFAPGFKVLARVQKNDVGFISVDHLTNNVEKGTMETWSDFYKNIYGWVEARYFDIQAAKTGLFSKVLQSPDTACRIPINEPKEAKSQIQEFLDLHKGPGVQHIALTTTDIRKTVSELRKRGFKFLDIPTTYYQTVSARVPNVKEPLEEIQDLNILLDGDETGYLLQIFTENQIGPLFFEVIQRRGHKGFGEGNFQALFEAIERDQERRGVL